MEMIDETRRVRFFVEQGKVSLYFVEQGKVSLYLNSLFNPNGIFAWLGLIGW